MKAKDIQELIRIGSEQGISMIPTTPCRSGRLTSWKRCSGSPAEHLGIRCRAIADDYKAATGLLVATSTIKAPNFIEYYVDDLFCTPQCLTADGELLYFDSTHLTLRIGPLTPCF